jgi:hypothetical protein
LAPDVGRSLLILSGCALLLAACGGDKQHAVRVYDRAPTMTCLRSHGFAVSTRQKDVGFIADSASGGGLRARKGRVDVIVAFGSGKTERHQILVGVGRLAPRASIFRYRIARANVVMMWAYRPSKKAQSVLISCLDAPVRG